MTSILYHKSYLSKLERLNNLLYIVSYISNYIVHVYMLQYSIVMLHGT